MQKELTKEHLDTVKAQTKVVKMLADPSSEVGVAGLEGRLQALQAAAAKVEESMAEKARAVLIEEGKAGMDKVRFEVRGLAKVTGGV